MCAAKLALAAVFWHHRNRNSPPPSRASCRSTYPSAANRIENQYQHAAIVCPFIIGNFCQCIGSMKNIGEMRAKQSSSNTLSILAYPRTGSSRRQLARKHILAESIFRCPSEICCITAGIIAHCARARSGALETRSSIIVSAYK